MSKEKRLNELEKTLSTYIEDEDITGPDISEQIENDPEVREAYKRLRMAEQRGEELDQKYKKVLNEAVRKAGEKK